MENLSGCEQKERWLWKESRRDATLLALKMKEGDHKPRNVEGRSLGARKDKEILSPRASRKEWMHLSQWDWYQTSNLKEFITIRLWICVVLSHWISVICYNTDRKLIQVPDILNTLQASQLILNTILWGRNYNYY